MEKTKRPTTSNAGALTTIFPSDMTDFVFAQIGIQFRTNDQPTQFIQLIQESFQLPNGPDHYDIATDIDTEQYTNHLFMVYWKYPEKYAAWLSQPGVQTWWTGNQIDKESKYGLFTEVATIPVTHFETIHAKENNDSGVTNFTSLERTKVHAYWGAMRDRIQASANDELGSNFGENLPNKQEKETFGKRLKVVAPGNICLIRTAQNWSQCSDAEKKTYLELVDPALQKAHQNLSTEREQLGCISAKLAEEIDADGNSLERSCVVGFFLSLKHLEQWTHEHAAHKAVFGTFFEMLKRHDYTTGLSLWHEVSVLQSEDLDLEYVNCHPKTGFLPYFETTELN